jgi:hypothetical protein
MSKESELLDAITKASVEVQGKKKLSCSVAFELSERFRVKKRDIGRICNTLNIKIYRCQLGCFD